MTKIKFLTSLGNITIELDESAAPGTVENFLRYVNEGFYNGTIFHRTIKGFMVQGGGMQPGMVEKTTHAPIKNEAKSGLKNTVGTISMARTGDPHSASAQFFINAANNSFLDFTSETVEGFGYCAFGKVTEGMDIVMKLSEVKTTQRAGHSDVPEQEVELVSAEVI